MIGERHRRRPRSRPVAWSGTLLAATTLACGLGRAAAAQEITGLVYSMEDRRPIAGATVQLLDARLVRVDDAVTDEIGRFTLRRPGPGSWMIIAEAAGFLSSPAEEFELAGAEDPGAFMLGLTPMPAEGPEVAGVGPRSGDGRTGLVTGVVVDRASEEPLDGAEIRLVGSERVAISRWDGRFTLGDVEPGPVTLRVSRLGHGTREHTVDIEAGLAYDLRFPLDQEAIPLEGVTVAVRSRTTARILEPVFERMRRGLGGHFLGPEELERLGSVSITQALQGLPMITVTGSGPRRRVLIRRTFTIRGGGVCDPMVYVDGQRVGKGELARDFLAMYASDVEVVEVYSSPTGMPPEFGTADYCAIGIWTERGG